MSKSERTRQFIIEQAAPIFNRKGVAGTAISDIMEATQLAKGGIYGNFDSKEEMSLEVCSYLLKRRGGQLTGAMEKGGHTARGKLMTFLDFFPEDVNSNWGGCPIVNLGVEADDTDPVMRQRLSEGIRAGQEVIRTVVQQGIDEGEFPPCVNAEVFAIKTFALIEGALLLGRIQGNTDQLERILEIVRDEIRSWKV